MSSYKRKEIEFVSTPTLHPIKSKDYYRLGK